MTSHWTGTPDKQLLQQVLVRLRVVGGPDAEGEYVCWCCFHPDGRRGEPPHRPNLQVSERNFFCRACGEKGHLRQLAQHLGIDGPRPPAEPDVCYDYRSADGKLLFQVCRFPKKRFVQRRPDGSGGWIWDLRGVRRVLYRLPELLEAAGRFKLGWADDLSGDLELSAAERGSGREGLGGRLVTVEIPVASSEQIAEAKAEWERKHERERQRRWRARKRAGLV